MVRCIPISKGRIAMLHVAKNQIGMTDPEYYAMLGRFGVKHSNELTLDQWPEVERHLKKCGFVKKKSTRKRTKNNLKPFPKGKKQTLEKIEAILADLKLPWKYADGIAQKMFQREGKAVKKLRFCDYNETRKVLQALIYHQKRSGKVYA